jgi:hypothetical protein
MVCCAWENLLTSPRRHFQRSACFFPVHWLLLTCQLTRERREHRVFTRLLEMVPGLEERLLEGTDEGVVHIAELVCSCVRFASLINCV